MGDGDSVVFSSSFGGDVHNYRLAGSSAFHHDQLNKANYRKSSRQFAGEEGVAGKAAARVDVRVEIIRVS